LISGDHRHPEPFIHAISFCANKQDFLGLGCW
jgi:hypothetical protein